MKRIIVGLFSIVLLAVLSGCEEKPVATVNSEKITKKMLDYALDERLAEHSLQGAQVKKEAMLHSVLKQLITERLIIQGAKEMNISVSKEEVDKEADLHIQKQGLEAFGKGLKAKGLTMADFKTRLKERVILNRFIDSLMKDYTVSEKDIRDFYENSPTPFLRPESVLVRLIQTQTEEQAKAIIKEIKDKGNDFDSVADRHVREGQLLVTGYGWIQPEMFDSKIIAGAMKNLKKGAFGGPYKGKNAYFILRIKDRQMKGPENLDEAREKIKAIILENQKQAVVSAWAAEKRNKSKIVINLN